MKNIKILIVVDQLEVGGAGRVCSILANGLAERNYQVCVCTAVKYHSIQYPLLENVEIKEWYDPEPIRHNIFGKALNMYNRFKYYRRALNEYKPNIIIAFTHFMYAYVKCWGYGYHIPIIASDHTSMGRDLGSIANYIRHKYYAKADAVTILTNKDYNLIGDSLPNRIVVYNPLTFDVNLKNHDRCNTILCVGRLDYWLVKGFDIMIEMWAEIANRHPEWRLELVGPGSAESIVRLQDLAEKFEVKDQVVFRGNQTDMLSVYQNASIFALPSRVEGFPMVLLEAMSQGCACLSFSMQGAIAEIINDGVDGEIVRDDDKHNFIRKMEALIVDSEKRERLSNAARTNVSRFSKDKFIDKWEYIIHKVLNTR